MARITVEDCLQNVDNIFQLVILASQRARRVRRTAGRGLIAALEKRLDACAADDPLEECLCDRPAAMIAGSAPPRLGP